MRVLICEPEAFSPRAIEALRTAGHDVCCSAGDLDRELVDVEVAIVRLGYRWDATRLNRAPNLRLLLTPTTGLDHIDLLETERRGIRVLSLRGLEGLNAVTSTPELAFGLMLALLRNIPAACNSVLQGHWDRDQFVGRELRGKRVGIVGFGRTGQAFARMCSGFQMDLAYFDPFVDVPGFRRSETLEALVADSEILSLHVVLNPQTTGLIHEGVFKACQCQPVLINTSRGAIVEEAALLEALQSGTLSGAAVDVICAEPEKGAVVDSALIGYARSHRNLLITPHIAGATSDAMRTTEELIVQAFLEG